MKPTFYTTIQAKYLTANQKGGFVRAHRTPSGSAPATETWTNSMRYKRLSSVKDAISWMTVVTVACYTGKYWPHCHDVCGHAHHHGLALYHITVGINFRGWENFVTAKSTTKITKITCHTACMRKININVVQGRLSENYLM